MKPMSLDELRELAPGFVMGTLTPDEQAHFAAAMAQPSLAAELAPEIEAHRAAIEFLATEHVVTPPPELKPRVLARISAEAAPERSALPFQAPGQANYMRAAPSRANRQPPPPRATFVPPQQIVQKGSRAPWFGMGMLGIALAASLVFALDITNQLHSVRSLLTEKDVMLKRNQSRLAERDETVRILTGGGNDLVLVRLVANTSAGPDMQVFWNLKEGTAVVHASGFRQLASDRTYALWMIRDGKPVALKLFNPEADGTRLLNGIEVPRNLQGVAAFAVTEEPAEGSPQPTMTPFLVGAVEAPKP